MISNRSYSPVELLDEVEEDSVTEKLLGQWFDPHKHLSPVRYRKAWLRYGPYFTHAALLSLAIVFFYLWLHGHCHCSDEPIYSPANVAIEYNKELNLNGTFNFPSEFRGYPTPEIDAAWMRISRGVRPLRLTLEQVLKTGKKDTPSKVKFREEDGGGYMGSLEFTHQLHCLNMLRKFTYKEYYEKFDPAFTEYKPEVFRMHLDHCIEILRQNLMCSADVVMITYEWVAGFSDPYPDFNTKHKCRNFDKILEWGNENAVHIPKGHVTRFGNMVDLPIAP